MHAEADEESEPAGRRAQSRSAEDARNRFGMYSVVAERRGMLMREAMLTVEKPWWTT